MNSTRDEHVSKVEISKIEKTLMCRISRLVKPDLFDAVVSDEVLQYSIKNLMNLATDDYHFIEAYYDNYDETGFYRLMPFVEIINWKENIHSSNVKMELTKSSTDYIESFISEAQLAGRHLTIDDVFKLPLYNQAKAFGSIALGILISLIVSAFRIDKSYYHYVSAYVKKVFINKEPLVLKLYYVPVNVGMVEDPSSETQLSCYSERTITVTFDYRGVTTEGVSNSISRERDNNQRTVSDEILDECR